MKKRPFTLIELLTVIVIIIVLAGLLLAAVTGSMKKANITKARAQMTTLANAIKQFEATYGRLPIPSGHDEKDVLSDNEYKWLILILQGETIDDSNNSSLKGYGKSASVNAKKVKFLNIVGNDPGVYQDPWDNDFKVFIDTSYDDKIEGSGNFINGLKGSKFHYKVMIYSLGPDEEHSSTVGNSANKDNVYSIDTKWNNEDEGHEILK